MDRHGAWFRRLLRLLPSDFQADYAADMERTFQAPAQAVFDGCTTVPSGSSSV